MTKQYPFENWTESISILTDSTSEMVKEVYDDLVMAYASSDRYYHNLIHVIDMFKPINEMMKVYTFKDQEKTKAMLILAAFYHDIVYDAKIPHHTKIYSDEDLSCDYAIKQFVKLNLSSVYDVQAIGELIRITQYHQIDEEMSVDTRLQEIFIDADMAIFGSESEKYRLYREAIRNEYEHLDIETYVLGRKKFLNNIKNNSIFLTEYMKQVYLEQALLNISDEIKWLDEMYIEFITNKGT